MLRLANPSIGDKIKDMYTQELIKEETVVHIFRILAWLLPCFGLIVGATFSLVKHKSQYLVWGIGVGLVGPLNLLLWRLFNSILDRFGFDSLKAFFLNIIIFALLGIILGFFLALLLKFHKKEV